MKDKILAILSSAILLISCSHSQKSEGNYFSQRQDCFAFGKGQAAMETFENWVKGNLRIKQRRHKVILWEWAIASKKIFAKRKDKYKFRYIWRNEDSFMISPTSKLSKDYFTHRDSIVFRSKYFYVDRNVKFEKIIYHSSRCGWYCPDLLMDIDSAGNVRLTNNGNGATDTVKSKNYRGRLSDADLEKLRSILRYAQLNTVKWNDQYRISDVSMITLIIYHNGQRLYLKSLTSPIVSSELTSYLYRIANCNCFDRVSETFQYEQ